MFIAAMKTIMIHLVGKSDFIQNTLQIIPVILKSVSKVLSPRLKCQQRMCEDAYRAFSNGSERSIWYLPRYLMNATDDSLIKSSNHPRLPI